MSASIRTLAAALVAHMKDKSMELNAVYKEASGGKKFKQPAFVKCLEGLPAACQRRPIMKRLTSKGSAVLTF